jgi:hypothetical protein
MPDFLERSRTSTPSSPKSPFSGLSLVRTLPYISVALFGDGAQRLLTAARVLTWRQAQPGGKIAPRFKNVRVRRAGGYHRGYELPNARNLVEQAAHLVLGMRAGNFAFQFKDRRVETFKLAGQNAHDRLGGAWKRRFAFGQPEQFIDAANPLGDDYAELGKMGA